MSMLNAGVYTGDCLDLMQEVKADSVDVIYMDPPFYTDKNHKLINKERTKEYMFKDIWENENSYMEFLRIRLDRMKCLLSPTGSVFVHCDRSGEHLIRSVLNDVFGARNFQSEIIWNYKRWSNSKKGLLQNHQKIYFYSKSKDFKFKRILMPYSESTNVDQILQRRTRDASNKSIYMLKNNKFVHADKKEGVPLGDVWDIPYLNPKAKERVGYPTQKPLLLLERILELVTDENDLVLDPFCGSGTTCVAAKLLNRKYIGMDISSEATELTKERLERPIKSESNLLKQGRVSYFNSKNEAISLLLGIEFNLVHRNKGIDAILIEKFENKPVLIRIQREEETLEMAASQLLNAMKKKDSAKSYLIQTTASDCDQTLLSKQGIVLVKSPALQIDCKRSSTKTTLSTIANA